MKSLKHLFLVSILMLLMAACTDKSLSPIFFTLETERSLTEDRGLEDEMTIHEIVKVGTRYFAAGNTLYTRTETGNWTPVSPPVSGALCNTIEIFGGDLYAGFFTKGGTGLGVYYADDPDNISWQQVPDVNVQDIQINFVKQAGTLFFVSRAGGSSDFSFWYSSDPLTVPFTESTSVDFPPTGSIPITDVAYDGADFWVTAGPWLYRGAVGTLAEVAGGPTNPGVKPFGGLLYTTVLYVSTKGGELWSYNGVTWSSESVTDSPSFTKFVDLDPVVGINGDIFVGTEGSGYFRLIGGDQTNYERRPDYNISALYNGAINCLFLDTSVTPEALFAGTMNAGLWRADYISGEWLWVQE